MRTIDDEFENENASWNYDYTDSTGIAHYRDSYGNRADEYEVEDRLDRKIREMSFDGFYVWCGSVPEDEASDSELELDDNWTPDEEAVADLTPIEAYNAPTYEVSNLWLEINGIESEDDIDRVLRDDWGETESDIRKLHPLIAEMLRNKQEGKK